jgi:hypothetical protein
MIQKKITRPRVLLPKVVDAFVQPLSDAGKLHAKRALRGDRIPGRYGQLFNEYMTDLFLVVEIEPGEDHRRFRKRRVHAWARYQRRNRQHFIVMQGKRFWIDRGHFDFMRSLARQDAKLLTYEQA